jgi:hypothetical protein
MPKSKFESMNTSPSSNFRSGTMRSVNQSADPSFPSPAEYFMGKEPISVAHLHKLTSDESLAGGSPNNILTL